jgi:hypothetical protein
LTIIIIRYEFDEDGMPDLASGYATGVGAGAIVIRRGNVDALWPIGAGKELLIVHSRDRKLSLSKTIRPSSEHHANHNEDSRQY